MWDCTANQRCVSEMVECFRILKKRNTDSSVKHLQPHTSVSQHIRPPTQLYNLFIVFLKSSEKHADHRLQCQTRNTDSSDIHADHPIHCANHVEHRFQWQTRDPATWVLNTGNSDFELFYYLLEIWNIRKSELKNIQTADAYPAKFHVIQMQSKK